MAHRGSREGSIGLLKQFNMHVTQTFAGGGGGTTNLFRVYGIVDVLYLYGIVETILNADVDNLSLDVFPGPVVLTLTVDSATAPVHSIFVKQTKASDALVLKSSAVPYITENADWKAPFVNTIIGAQEDGTPTYIRCVYSGVATNGAIDWHVDFIPLSDNGLLVVV